MGSIGEYRSQGQFGDGPIGSSEKQMKAGPKLAQLQTPLRGAGRPETCAVRLGARKLLWGTCCSYTCVAFIMTKCPQCLAGSVLRVPKHS